MRLTRLAGTDADGGDINFVILFAHKRACDGGDGSVSSERVTGSRLFGTDSFAARRRRRRRLLWLCARARACGVDDGPCGGGGGVDERTRARSAIHRSDGGPSCVVRDREAGRVPGAADAERRLSGNVGRRRTATFHPRVTDTQGVLQGTVIINQCRVHSMSYCRLSMLS